MNLSVPSDSRRDIIVVGASAGGVAALKELVAALPRDLEAAVLVVLHLSPQGPDLLQEILVHVSPLPVSAPLAAEAIQSGRIYVASPDHHLLVQDSSVRAARGPKENNHRPAIDVLFRSAAASFGPRVLGVVLTGLLNDGAAGLWAVQSWGGITVVQDPDEAAYPDMPSAALTTMAVDHRLPLAEIAQLIERLCGKHETVVPGSTSPKPRSLRPQLEMANDLTVEGP